MLKEERRLVCSSERSTLLPFVSLPESPFHCPSPHVPLLLYHVEGRESHNTTVIAVAVGDSRQKGQGTGWQSDGTLPVMALMDGYFF